MFRHLFGVGLPELLEWPFARWQYHREYAEAELKRRGVLGG